MQPFISGDWSGILNLLLTLLFGLVVIIVAAIWADRFGRKNAPLIMVALMAGLQMMVSFTSAKFVGLYFNGKPFFIIAGSLMYPLLACGEDYINEFYGKNVAKASVLAQLIVRVLSTLFLIWIIFLPPPADGQANFDNFANLMGIVPRVAAASIIATYIASLLNVNIFAKIKERTSGNLLWLRVFISTTIGLAVNAALFTILAFGGVRSVSDIIEMILISVAVRLVTGLVEVIFLYFMSYLRDIGFILRDKEPLIVKPVSKEQIA